MGLSRIPREAAQCSAADDQPAENSFWSKPLCRWEGLPVSASLVKRSRELGSNVLEKVNLGVRASSVISPVIASQYLC